MASVTLKGIYKKYAGGVTAVSDFNLDIEDKEFIELCGEDNDIVLANILPEVLVPLSENIEKNVKMGGYIIYSGILEFKVQEVVDAINANRHFEVKEIREQGEWRAIVATRNK